MGNAEKAMLDLREFMDQEPLSTSDERDATAELAKELKLVESEIYEIMHQNEEQMKSETFLQSGNEIQNGTQRGQRFPLFFGETAPEQHESQPLQRFDPITLVKDYLMSVKKKAFSDQAKKAFGNGGEAMKGFEFIKILIAIADAVQVLKEIVLKAIIEPLYLHERKLLWDIEEKTNTLSFIARIAPPDRIAEKNVDLIYFSRKLRDLFTLFDPLIEPLPLNSFFHPANIHFRKADDKKDPKLYGQQDVPIFNLGEPSIAERKRVRTVKAAKGIKTFNAPNLTAKQIPEYGKAILEKFRDDLVVEKTDAMMIEKMNSAFIYSKTID